MEKLFCTGLAGLALFEILKGCFIMPMPVVLGLLTAAIAWIFDFELMADRMFKQPQSLVLKSRAENRVPGSSVVAAIEHNGDARACPIRCLIHRHQVQDDTVGGKAFIVTCCSVCRTGRG